MKHATIWLAVLLMTVLFAASYVLGGPNEIDEAVATSRNVQDAVHAANLAAIRASKGRP